MLLVGDRSSEGREGGYFAIRSRRPNFFSAFRPFARINSVAAVRPAFLLGKSGRGGGGGGRKENGRKRPDSRE